LECAPDGADIAADNSDWNCAQVVREQLAEVGPRHSGEWDRLSKELQPIDAALSAFGKAYGKGAETRKLSASARARIAAAQHPGTLATVDTANGYWPTGALRKLTFGNNLTESDVYTVVASRVELM